MTQADEFVFMGAFLVGVALSLGIAANILVFVFWPKLKSAVYFPLNESKVPWGVRDVAILFVIYFLLQLIIGSLLFLVSKSSLFTQESLRYFSLFWATMGVNLIILMVLFAILSKKYRIDWEHFGFKKERILKNGGLGALSYVAFLPIFFLLLIVSLLVCSIFGIEPEPHVIVQVFQEEKSPLFLFYLVVFASFLGPLFEEILFRGFLYPAAKKRWGMRKALIGTALFFALIHFNAFQFIPVFGLGLMLTLLYEATGSLIPSIVLHVFNNTVSVAVTFYIMRSQS